MKTEDRNHSPQIKPSNFVNHKSQNLAIVETEKHFKIFKIRMKQAKNHKHIYATGTEFFLLVNQYSEYSGLSLIRTPLFPS